MGRERGRRRRGAVGHHGRRAGDLPALQHAPHRRSRRPRAGAGALGLRCAGALAPGLRDAGRAVERHPPLRPHRLPRPPLEAARVHRAHPAGERPALPGRAGPPGHGHRVATLRAHQPHREQLRHRRALALPGAGGRGGGGRAALPERRRHHPPDEGARQRRDSRSRPDAGSAALERATAEASTDPAELPRLDDAPAQRDAPHDCTTGGETSPCVAARRAAHRPPDSRFEARPAGARLSSAP